MFLPQRVADIMIMKIWISEVKAHTDREHQ